VAGAPAARRRGAGPPPPSLVDGLTGLIPYLGEVPTLRGDPDVFVAVTHTADLVAYDLQPGAEINGSGAGLTAAAARGAAIGESVERYASCIIHPERLIYASARELAEQGRPHVGPESWALYHPSQWGQIPFAPFEPHTKVAWVRAESLTRREERWIPACPVYLGSTAYLCAEGAQLIAPGVSTGTACATSRAEALLKGLCEVVERDAFMITWRNRLARPRLRIDERSWLHRVMQERFCRPGLEYQLFLTTLDLGIPSIFGYLRDQRRTPPAIVVGGAAHPDPAVAALKTLLELVQGLKWIDVMGESGFAPEPGFANVRSFTDRVALYAFNDLAEAFAFLSQSGEVVDLSRVPSLDTGMVEANWRRCRDLVAASGLEVLAFDLTPVDALECGLHVIKVLVPAATAMEGDHRFPFLGGNRWREIPWQLGLRPTPAGLDELNPFPHPYP